MAGLSTRANSSETGIAVSSLKGKRRSELDHKHRLRMVRPYDYRDAAALVADFWAEVEAVMREKGVWS